MRIQQAPPACQSRQSQVCQRFESLLTEEFYLHRLRVSLAMQQGSNKEELKDLYRLRSSSQATQPAVATRPSRRRPRLFHRLDPTTTFMMVSSRDHNKCEDHLLLMSLMRCTLLPHTHSLTNNAHPQTGNNTRILNRRRVPARYTCLQIVGPTNAHQASVRQILLR